MDLNILYALQGLREAMPDILIRIINAIADIPAGLLPTIIMAIIYWDFDKKAGTRLLGAYTSGTAMNGLLKVSATVYRPWIRDSRLYVAPVAESAATGYSFPSGHSTSAGSFYGGIADNYGKKAKWITPLCVVLMIFTIFARMLLGAHTPQDVTVGLALGILMVFLSGKILDYADRGDKELRNVFIGIAVFAVLLVIYTVLKPYPMDVDSAGNLLADPKRMMKDTIDAAGIYFGFGLGYFFERKCVGFDVAGDKKTKILRVIVGLVIVIFFYAVLGKIMKNTLGILPAAFIKYTLVYFGILGLVPYIFKKTKLA